MSFPVTLDRSFNHRLRGTTLVQGNLIGTNAAGTALWGMALMGGNQHLARRNTMAEQPPQPATSFRVTTFAGSTPPVLRMSFKNNLIGTNGAGMNLGNADTGLYIAGDNNTVGGGVGLGNTIAFNRGKGLVVASGSGNVISSRIPILLQHRRIGDRPNDDGVTPNDTLDADVGANRLQNFPCLAAVNKARHYCSRPDQQQPRILLSRSNSSLILRATHQQRRGPDLSRRNSRHYRRRWQHRVFLLRFPFAVSCRTGHHRHRN